jgi:hypothetical protein
MSLPEEVFLDEVQPFDILSRLETISDPRGEMMEAFYRASIAESIDRTTGQEVVTYGALLRDFRTQRASEVMSHSGLEGHFVDEEWFRATVNLEFQFLLAPAIEAVDRVLNGRSALRDEASTSMATLHTFEDENRQLLEDLRADIEERVPDLLEFGQLRLALSIDATTDSFVGDNPLTRQPAVSGSELARILRDLADKLDGKNGRELQGTVWTLYDQPGRPVGEATTIPL